MSMPWILGGDAPTIIVGQPYYLVLEEKEIVIGYAAPFDDKKLEQTVLVFGTPRGMVRYASGRVRVMGQVPMPEWVPPSSEYA